MQPTKTEIEGQAAFEASSPDLVVQLTADGGKLHFEVQRATKSVACQPDGDITVKFEVGRVGAVCRMVFLAGPTMSFRGLGAHRIVHGGGVLQPIHGTPLWVDVSDDGQACIVEDRYDGTLESFGRFSYTLHYEDARGIHSFDPQINNEPTGGDEEAV